MLHPQPLSAEEIIKALGGPTAISEDHEISAKRSAVSNWPKDGIPAKFWPALARRAARLPGAAHITIAELERHTCPRKAA